MARIALIHALAQSLAPVNEALARSWPEARRMNLLDDSLSADLEAGGSGLDGAMQARFDALADYALATGAEAILFTCSAFGPCIDAVARRLAPRQVLKPYSAMVEAAALHVRSHGGRIGLVASFAPTLAAMPAEFPADATPFVALAEGALASLQAGDTAAHDAAAAHAALALRARRCTLIALAQYSLARAAPAVRAATGLPVLTSVDTAVATLRAGFGVTAR